MTFVKTYIAVQGGPSAIDLALGEIEHYFEYPPHRAALRLCCAGLSGRQGKTSPEWAPMEKVVKELFPGKHSEDIVERHKIKRFAHSLYDQETPKNLHAYIGLVVCHMLAGKPGLRSRSAIAEGLHICDFPSVLADYCASGGAEKLRWPQETPIGNGEPVDPVQAPSLRVALGVGKQDLTEIGQRFFKQHGPVVGEESYYACYRFSMTEPEIVKTFLSLRSPTSDVDRFTFHHIYRFETKSGATVTKVADGDVMHLDNAFYLLGASKQLLDAKTERTQGLKMIAVPKDSLVPEPRLLSGLFMSASLHGEPIVGRLALLHLGYRRNGGGVAEADIEPRVIKSLGDFEKDVLEASTLGYPKPLPHLPKQMLAFMSNKALLSKGKWKVTRAIAAVPSKSKQG